MLACPKGSLLRTTRGTLKEERDEIIALVLFACYKEPGYKEKEKRESVKR